MAAVARRMAITSSASAEAATRVICVKKNCKKTSLFIEKTHKYLFYSDQCASAPCQNGGKCENNPGIGYSCKCPIGFSGTICEHNDNDCSPLFCLNGGVCVDGVNSYQCRCPVDFTGKTKGKRSKETLLFSGLNCQRRVEEREFLRADELEVALCRQHDCGAKARNGKCDAECNYYACGYDAGDCSANQPKLFEQCGGGL